MLAYKLANLDVSDLIECSGSRRSCGVRRWVFIVCDSDLRIYACIMLYTVVLPYIVAWHCRICMDIVCQSLRISVVCSGLVTSMNRPPIDLAWLASCMCHVVSKTQSPRLAQRAICIHASMRLHTLYTQGASYMYTREHAIAYAIHAGCAIDPHVLYVYLHI